MGFNLEILIVIKFKQILIWATLYIPMMTSTRLDFKAYDSYQRTCTLT